MIKIYLYILIMALSIRVNCQQLKSSTIIDHFKGDSLKQKAALFLLNNMYLHYSNDRVWLNALGEELNFNELDYTDYKTALNKFKEFENTYPNISALAISYADSDTITNSYVINHINHAFKVWQNPWCNKINFTQFCEYILPYRVMTEPIQNWQKTYEKHNAWVVNELKDNGFDFEACFILNDSIGETFINTFAQGKRQEPLPLLGPLNLKHRLQGDCADMVNYTCYCMRSIGIPCVVDFVPYWGTSSGRHFWNVTLNHNGKAQYFMGGGKNPGNYRIYKEMPKVYRFTYQNQPTSLANRVPKEELIPDTLLCKPNILDVTHLYLPTTNLTIQCEPSARNKTVYLCVHNNLAWKPVCGAITDKQGVATFKEMGRGIIYVPMIYKNHRFIPVANPHIITTSGELKVISATSQTIDITMKQEDGYLIFRPKKNYKLYYWNKRWILHSTLVYEQNQQLKFNHVPANTLYLMVPEYTWGKERVFTINNDGTRHWW